MNDLPKLTPSRPDSEIAADIRRQLEESYKPIIDILNEASSHNFIVNCNIGRNNFGRIVFSISIVKDLL